MKVLIYVHKRDVISGNITKYYTYGPPQSSEWPNYVQIQISRDEFVRLEDREEDVSKIQNDVEDKDQWLIDQYNRNRLADEQISNLEDIESDQDNQPFAD